MMLFWVQRPVPACDSSTDRLHGPPMYSVIHMCRTGRATSYSNMAQVQREKHKRRSTPEAGEPSFASATCRLRLGRFDCAWVEQNA